MKFTMRLFSHLIMLLALCVVGGLAPIHNAQANQLKGVRAWPSPDSTRIVLDLSSKPGYKVHYLKDPDRLLIDLQSTKSSVDLGKIVNNGPLVKKLRESASDKKSTYRLAIDMSRASKATVFLLPPEKPYGHRLVLDLPHKTTASKAAIAPVTKKTSATVPVGRDVIIAIDAGHGGEDPGALGKYTYEKNVTLQIAKRLKKRIDQQKGIQAFLIRTGDYYLNLNKRSAIARKKKADFLVSIHADGFTSSRPRGASVWVLSNRRATTELGRWMEKHEAHSELLGGAGTLIKDSSSVPFLTEMFLDMSMGNAMDVGYHAGNLVVNELKKVTKLHKKKPVHASLAVLKSPDIPSILVEAGFITNRSEEKLLNQSEHQNKIANAVFTGIYKHFLDAPPQDTLFAQKKRAIKHTVRSGESLSVLAARYSVTMKQLQSYNNLRSRSLKIGQVIKVPPNYHLVVKQEPARATKTMTQTKLIHRVKRGESLSVIAQHYGKSTAELKSYNKMRSTVLSVGQKINIPEQVVVTVSPVQRATTPKQKRQVVTHKVKRGESLSVIAAHYGKSTTELKNYNKLRSTVLAVGQKINIPGQMVAVVASAKAETKAIQKTQPVVHRVKRGESLSVIAAHYGKTMTELKTYNKLSSTVLAVGQQINIPNQKTASVTRAKVAPKPTVHKVKSGESLSVIAARYGKTMAQLKRDNNLRSSSLKIGQILYVAGPKKQVAPRDKLVAKPVKASPPNVHKVKSGESLSVIAQRYGKTTSALKSYNKLRSSSLLVGQKLKIPGSATAQKKAVVTTPRVHKVKAGESLSLIAQRYGKTTAQLKSYNKLRSTAIRVGQSIKIPGASYAVPAKVAKVSHKVKRGESLSVIASRFGTTTKLLKSHNKLNSSALQVGQVINIPTSFAQFKKHKVRSGESLSVIATRYGTTTNALKAYNKLRSTSLAIGQVLTVPVT